MSQMAGIANYESIASKLRPKSIHIYIQQKNMFHIHIEVHTNTVFPNNFRLIEPIHDYYLLYWSQLIELDQNIDREYDNCQKLFSGIYQYKWHVYLFSGFPYGHQSQFYIRLFYRTCLLLDTWINFVIEYVVCGYHTMQFLSYIQS